MNETRKSEDLFIPEEITPELRNLFKNVESLINGFMESESSNYEEDEIRRFVAGHVCFEMLQDVRGSFAPFSKVKKIYPWNIYVRNQLKKEAEKSRSKRFSDNDVMGEISEDFAALKENNPEAIEELAHIAKAEMERSATVDLQFRHELFKKDWKKMKKNMNYFQQNYRTHIIMIRATDTNHVVLYPFLGATNSSKLLTKLDWKFLPN